MPKSSHSSILSRKFEKVILEDPGIKKIIADVSKPNMAASERRAILLDLHTTCFPHFKDLVLATVLDHLANFLQVPNEEWQEMTKAPLDLY